MTEIVTPALTEVVKNEASDIVFRVGWWVGLTIGRVSSFPPKARESLMFSHIKAMLETLPNPTLTLESLREQWTAFIPPSDAPDLGAIEAYERIKSLVVQDLIDQGAAVPLSETLPDDIN